MPKRNDGECTAPVPEAKAMPYQGNHRNKSCLATVGSSASLLARRIRSMSYFHVAQLLALSSFGLFVSTVALLVAWLRARDRAARAEAFLEGRSSLRSEPERLAPAIEAIAIEVERVGEAQRFLTRVLSERPPQAETTSKRPSGSVTPH
jgi:hypothetical protein